MAYSSASAVHTAALFSIFAVSLILPPISNGSESIPGSEDPLGLSRNRSYRSVLHGPETTNLPEACFFL